MHLFIDFAGLLRKYSELINAREVGFQYSYDISDAERLLDHKFTILSHRPSNRSYRLRRP